MQESYRRNGK